MWKEIVEREKEWIGGKLIDYGDSMDRTIGEPTHETTITGFKLTDDWFEVSGERFSCGGNRKHLGISSLDQNGKGIVLSGYGGHKFKIIKRSS